MSFGADGRVKPDALLHHGYGGQSLQGHSSLFLLSYKNIQIPFFRCMFSPDMLLIFCHFFWFYFHLPDIFKIIWSEDLNI